MAEQTEKFYNKDSNTIIATIKEVSKKFGWRIVKEDNTNNTVYMQTQASILSWGEVVEVKVEANLQDNTVSVSVISKATAQAFDWGKSADNVRKLIQALKSS